MSSVYVLMKGRFEYGEYYDPRGEELCKVYTDFSEAKEQCAELNARAWEKGIHQVLSHRIHITCISTYPPKVGGSVFEDEEYVLYDNELGDQEVVSDEKALERDTSHAQEQENDADDFIREEGYESSAARFPLNPREAPPYTPCYTLATLHQKLISILGDKTGALWTTRKQWKSWRVPAITPDESAELSRVFGFAFYQVIEVEMG